MSKICFVICTERGKLEAQSLLLVESLRRYGGALSDAHVMSFSPRVGCVPRSSTLARLEAMNVEINTEPLNITHHQYPIMNKLLATSYVETRCSHDVVVMLDSDMVFLDEPSGLLVPPGIDVALRPVHKKNIAASPGNPLPPLWKDVFELLPPARLVTTTTGVEGIPIVGYWNAGLVSSRASTRFFTRVLHNMLSLEGRVSFGGSSAYFRDQVAIAATIMHHDIPFVELPLSYNYPFNPFVIPLLRIESLDNIVCLHYHRRFEKHMFRNPLATDFCPGQRREWLDTRVHELGMFPPPWKVYKTHLARRVSARLHRLFSL